MLNLVCWMTFKNLQCLNSQHLALIEENYVPHTLLKHVKLEVPCLILLLGIHEGENINTILQMGIYPGSHIGRAKILI